MKLYDHPLSTTSRPVWLFIADNGVECGPRVVADYFGRPFVALGEVLRCDYSAFPNVSRWLERMKALKNWAKVHEVLYGFAASLKDKSFVAV